MNTGQFVMLFISGHGMHMVQVTYAFPVMLCPLRFALAANVGGSFK